MAVEILPEIVGAAAGYVAGLPLEWHAQLQAAREQQPILSALRKTSREQGPEADPNTARRVGHLLNTKAVSFIAGLTAAGGAFAGLAFEQSHAHQAVTAKVEWVVDHSGATGLQIGNNLPALSEINHVVTSVGNAPGINSEVIVAGNNGLTNLPVSEVGKDAPQGQAMIATATSQALSRTANSLPVSDGKVEKRNAAVFIVTNGNPAGAPESVVAAAQSKNGTTPVYVVNVEGESQATTTRQLQEIAKETHGKYWNTKQANIEDVTKSLKKTIAAYERPNADRGLEIFEISMAAFCLGMTGVAYKRRRHLPINKGLK